MIKGGFGPSLDQLQPPLDLVVATPPDAFGRPPSALNQGFQLLIFKKL